MKLKLPILMEMISKNSLDNSSRQFEAYLRKEKILSFISSGEKMILDVGCGGGVMSVYLARLGHLVTSLDSSKEYVYQARELAEKYSVAVDFRIGTAEKVDFPDRSFDFVICEETLEHLEKPLDVLKKFNRLL